MQSGTFSYILKHTAVLFTHLKTHNYVLFQFNHYY